MKQTKPVVNNFGLMAALLAVALFWTGCTGLSESVTVREAQAPATAVATVVGEEEPVASEEVDPASTPAPTVAMEATGAEAPAEPAATQEPETTPAASVDPVPCEPTPPDMMGPFYEPDAPERTSVGQGHLLGGVVRSSEDCTPIPGARLEFWLAGPDGQYGDAYRATMFADDAGAYQFESNVPPSYAQRPPHIHLRVTAAGYEPLVTQYYPAEGQTEGNLDPVLVPEMAAREGDDSQTAAAPPGAVQDLPEPTLFDVAWSDRSDFQPGLIESEQAVLEALPGASVYHLDLQLADELDQLTGQEEILYTNQETEPLDEIYIRLFPNLTGGSTTVTDVTVNDQPVAPVYELEDSAMRLPLSPALAPGEQVVIRMAFSVEIPTEEGGNYGTFALAEGVLALAHAYPMIAVYDDEGWNVEIAPPIGDVIYADSSFFRVRVTAPASPTIAASGIEIERTQDGDQQIITFAAGPVRDFYLAASDRYTVASQTIGQTTVNSYAPTDLENGAELALQYAVQSLESFNDRIGPYPFTEFDLVSTTTFALGVEYPGIVAILVDLYEPGSRNRALLESVVAHEVAHQWFYSVIGNDQVDEPWLDEALTQYATLLYYLDIHGGGGAAGFRDSLERRWSRVDRAEIPVGMPVRAYTPEEYSAIVYGRGPLFVDTLAETMGQDTFNTFLQDYYQTYQWDTAGTEAFKQLAETHCDCDLDPLFETWVYENVDGS